MKFSFRAEITPNHKLRIFGKKTFDTCLLTYPVGQQIEITVGVQKKRRSNPQNAYYWAVPVKLLGDYLGYEDDEIHEALKWQFLKIEGDPPSVRSTKKLSTTEFNEYIEKIIRWAALEFQVVIPDPSDVEADGEFVYKA